MSDLERFEAIIKTLMDALLMWGIDYLTWRSVNAVSVDVNDQQPILVKEPITVGKLADALNEGFNTLVQQYPLEVTHG